MKQAITYKCPGCGSFIKYDPGDMFMTCDSCGQVYDMSDFKDEDLMPENDASTQSDEIVDDEFMDINVYSCSSCGSHIMTSDVEVSKNCSFCGQPTIMFDKLSHEKRPQKIIPFAITKEVALRGFQERFADAKYVVDGVSEPTLDKIQGIYMPYWVFDTKSEVKGVVNVKEKDGYSKHPFAESGRTNVVLDASKRFNDRISILLNPYNVDRAVPFNSTYLSGYFADVSDVELDWKEDDAKSYMKDILVNNALDRTPSVPPKATRDAYHNGSIAGIPMYDVSVSSEKHEVLSKTYMFLPVYIITYVLNNEAFLVLVNGQTGKLVGNIPIDKKKVVRRQILDSVIFMVIMGAIGGFLFSFAPIWWAGGLLALITFFVNKGFTHERDVFNRRYVTTNSSYMFDLTKNREK